MPALQKLDVIKSLISQPLPGRRHNMSCPADPQPDHQTTRIERLALEPCAAEADYNVSNKTSSSGHSYCGAYSTQVIYTERIKRSRFDFDL